LFKKKRLSPEAKRYKDASENWCCGIILCIILIPFSTIFLLAMLYCIYKAEVYYRKYKAAAGQATDAA